MIRTEGILKRIGFKFRIDFDAEYGGKVLLSYTYVETVVWIRKNESVTLEVVMGAA